MHWRLSLAGDAGLIYDFSHISEAQSWRPDHQRPYVYLPTGLLIFAPLTVLALPVIRKGGRLRSGARSRRISDCAP